MLFKKPKDVRYVDMAIWLDAHMYEEDVDENQVFEYLWHLCLMLARKNKFFNKTEYYEDFATYLATLLYFRIKNPKQFDDNFKMQKIKSILNYIKNIIYPRKVDFEQEYYSQVVTPPDESKPVEYALNYTFSDMLSESVDELSRVEFDACLEDIDKTIRRFLRKIPYRTNKVEWNNIYISCLLTLLDNITLDNKTKERISNFKYKDLVDSTLDIQLLQSKKGVILYHLNDNMSGYIHVLVREIQKVLSNDLSSFLKFYVPSNAGLSYIALAEINCDSTNARSEDEN